MAKDKNKDKTKGARNVPNKHLHGRVSFLHQAAALLAVQGVGLLGHSTIESPIIANNELVPQRPASASAPLEGSQIESQGTQGQDKSVSSEAPGDGLPLCPLSIHLNSHLRQVARKSQIRLHPAIKRMSCKTCNTILIEGQTCSKYLENLSKGGKKRHADVLVLECTSCGSKKRFPVGAKRQGKKSHRLAAPDRGQDITEKNRPYSLPG